MLGFYNTNYNNSYLSQNQNYGYQNYGYGQSVMNPYQQQSSLFGGYSNYQQPANNMNSMLISMLNSLLPSLLGLFSNRQAVQQPVVSTVPATSSISNSITGNSGQNNILNSIFGNLFNNSASVATTVPVTTTVASTVPATGTISNAITGNSGQNNIYNTIINILLNSQAGKTPVTIDEETIEIVPKEQVFLVGAYKRTDGTFDLGSTIEAFAGTGASEYTSHDRDSSNNAALLDLLSKMSDEDKNLKFDTGQAYIITESGKIIDQVASDQLVDNNKNAFVGRYTGSSKHDDSYWEKFDITEAHNSGFKVLEDLGIVKTDYNSTTSGELWKTTNAEEANGGQIELNGRKYNVATTVLRKETPLTFDLNGDGVKTSDKLTQFDINGDGKKETINDVADGTLSIRGGKDARDLFGNNTDLDGDGKADGFANGFDALKALATKEGLINGKDDMKLDAKDLQILKAKYQLGMKTAGYNSEAKDLEEAGITEINLGNTDKVKEKVNFDGRNNDVLTQDGATFKINGKNREYADVLHAIKA